MVSLILWKKSVLGNLYKLIRDTKISIDKVSQIPALLNLTPRRHNRILSLHLDYTRYLLRQYTDLKVSTIERYFTTALFKILIQFYKAIVINWSNDSIYFSRCFYLQSNIVYKPRRQGGKVSKNQFCYYYLLPTCSTCLFPDRIFHET